MYISCTHVHFLQTSKGSFEKTKTNSYLHTHTHTPPLPPPLRQIIIQKSPSTQASTAQQCIESLYRSKPCWMIEVERSRISSVIKVHEVRRFSKEGPRSEDLLWAAVFCMKECVCTFCPQRLDLFRASSSV